MEGESMTAGVGTPSLVCRWRLSDGGLPLANRHLRALRSREVAGRPVPQPLIAWAKEHIEQTVGKGGRAVGDGVLLLVVDKRFHATMAVEPRRRLVEPTARTLLRRARVAQEEAAASRVAPETLWVFHDDRLVWLDDSINVASGTASLMRDLASTLGIGLERRSLSTFAHHRHADDATFLVSDEHGVVVPTDCDGAQAQRFADAYDKLLADMARRNRGRMGAGRKGGG